MGRNLLNTKRNATIIKGGEVIGYVSDDDRINLEKSYKIAEYIIEANNYFENRELVY